MKRLGISLIALSLFAWSCGSSGDDYAGSITRTVRVDWNFDEVAVSFLAYYPQVVEVRPGDTLNFKQAWTGEGHSVTMGTMVDDAIKPVREIIKSGNIPDEPPPEIEAKLAPLPTMLNEDGSGVNQAAGQPCYLAAGAPPLDRATPCPKVPQPEFNGRQTYYSSGFIPYEGGQSNTYRVKLSKDIAPGTYTFYCNYHGPLQSGEIVVKPAGTKVASQATVDRQARQELKKQSDPIVKAYDAAKAGKAVDPESGQPIRTRLSGWYSEQVEMALIDEFIPRTIRAKVNEKVTWTFVGPHTVSFNVPPYLPQFIISGDGTVTINPQAYQPVNSPAVPTFEEGAPPADIDGGRWDGSNFISSGLIAEGTYSLTFTKTGRYRYACLVHPRMVGEVVVS